MRIRLFHRYNHLIFKFKTSIRLYTNNHNQNVRVRFGPSPTGMMHLGGLRTALYNYLFAKANNGTFIVRIENTDQTRCIQGVEKKLEEDLQWAGIIPDESPISGGNFGPYLQSERLDLYQEEIKKLIENGSAYHCFCTSKRLELIKKDAARRGESPKYDNKCRYLTSTELEEKLQRKVPFVIRLKLESCNESFEDLIKGSVSHNVAEVEGDPVLLKSDKFPTYHFANVVDDHHMNITHVLRGEEWLTSTPKHIILYQAFGWEMPKFAHLPLILNRNGTKLSKRQNDIQVEHLRQSGYFPEAVINYVTKVGGGFTTNNLSGLNINELISLFDLKLVKQSSGRLDPIFLEEANRNHLIRKLKENPEKLFKMAREIIEDSFPDRVKEIMQTDQDYSRILEWGISEGRMSSLNDLTGSKFDIFWSRPSSDQLKNVSVGMETPKVLKEIIRRLKNVAEFQKEPVYEVLKCHLTEDKISMKQYMALLRMALCGLKKGPPVAEIMTIIGKEESINRLENSIQMLSD